MSKSYQPTPTELWMIKCLNDTIKAICAGEIDSVGLCASHVDGDPSFVYYNTPDEPVLRPALSRLIGLYEMNNRGNKGRINAPHSNRSYRTH